MVNSRQYLKCECGRRKGNWTNEFCDIHEIQEKNQQAAYTYLLIAFIITMTIIMVHWIEW